MVNRSGEELHFKRPTSTLSGPRMSAQKAVSKEHRFKRLGPGIVDTTPAPLALPK